ncbi:MAG TPA: tail fiber domain-containing protein [Bacteroidota bacterium]|nr:tail fiber domain-containing protein [Bacteroidota bacterium]
MKSFLFVILLLVFHFVDCISVYSQDPRASADQERAVVSRQQILTGHSLRPLSVNTTSLPLKMSYQGLLTTTGGIPLADGAYNLTVSLYDSLTNGSLLWTEAHSGVPVQRGTFSITFGGTTPLNLQFNKPLFLQVVASNGPAGPSYPLTFSPRSELSSTPYSLAPWVTKGADLYYNNGKIGIGSSAPESCGIANLKLDIADETGVDGNVAVRVAGQNADGGGYPSINLAKSRGALATPTSVNQSDFLGQVNFLGHDGSAYLPGAGIFGIVDSTPGPASVPTRMTFYTRNQANGFAKRLQLDRNGSLDIDPWAFNAGALSPGLTFGSDYYTGEGIASKRNTGGNQWGLDFYTAFHNRMSITNTGNVGFGISTPFAQVQINDSSNGITGARLALTQAVSGSTLFDGLALIHTWPNGFLWNYENGAILFGTNNNERMRVDSAGRVGLGTATPTSKLEIAAQDGLAITGNQPFLTLRDTSAGGARFVLGSANGDLNLYPNSFIGGSPAVTVKSASGNVGIGMASPPYQFSVQAADRVLGWFDNTATSGTPIGLQGTAQGAGGTNHYGVVGFASGGTTNYGVYAGGDLVYTGNLIHASDAGFKENVLDYSGALSKIMMIRPRTFTFKSGGDYDRFGFAAGKHFGFLAQELEQVFPELVVTATHPPEPDGKGGTSAGPVDYKGVKTMEIIPILVQAVQEQQKLIEELQAKVARLEKK